MTIASDIKEAYGCVNTQCYYAQARATKKEYDGKQDRLTYTFADNSVLSFWLAGEAHISTLTSG